MSGMRVVSLSIAKLSKQKIINCLVLFSSFIVLSFSLLLVSIPDESRVSFIPSYKVSLSLDLSISDAQMIFIKDQVSLNNKKYNFLSENHYFINSNYSTLKKHLYLNSDFSYLRITLKKIYPNSVFKIKNICVGGGKIDPKYVDIVPSKANVYESDIYVDLSKYKEIIKLQQIDTPTLKLLFYYVCNLVQLHFKLLFIVFSCILSVVTLHYKNNKVLLLFYLSVLYAAISYLT